VAEPCADETARLKRSVEARNNTIATLSRRYEDERTWRIKAEADLVTVRYELLRADSAVSDLKQRLAKQSAIPAPVCAEPPPRPPQKEAEKKAPPRRAAKRVKPKPSFWDDLVAGRVSYVLD
jgi:hypothetical protein